MGAFSGYTLEDAKGGGAKKAPPPSKPAAKEEKKKAPEPKAAEPPQQAKDAAPAPPKPAAKGERQLELLGGLRVCSAADVHSRRLHHIATLYKEGMSI